MKLNKKLKARAFNNQVSELIYVMLLVPKNQSNITLFEETWTLKVEQ